MGKIIYVCHYDVENGSRKTSPAGLTLMNYVINTVNSLGRDITVFSPAQQHKNILKDRETVRINEKTTAIFMKSFKRYTKLKLPPRFIYVKQIENQTYKELYNLIDDGDTVIAYHSIPLMNVFLKLRKKKKFNFILQVAEIYADVSEDKKNRQKEIDFIKTADKYILISDLLKKELNIQNKECIVCSGLYEAEKEINTPPNDGKIHVVYAGTLESTKGGAYFAVESAKYLTEKYHVHILGFGNEQQKSQFLNFLETNEKEFNCTVTYDGCLQGEAYKNFLQGCHIGLSTQNPDGAYNATSFPSKILVYLANGLNVVSINIPVIEASPVSSVMNFYKESNPSEIAKAILSVDINKKSESRELINNLNQKFVSEINSLL
ncbi:MAG: hypothetical protein IKA02_05710 [Clostridia bacterium]|nr:hypothetical protein [Clostridia bacterium]